LLEIGEGPSYSLCPKKPIPLSLSKLRQKPSFGQFKLLVIGAGIQLLLRVTQNYVLMLYVECPWIILGGLMIVFLVFFCA
jgi:hypothetical protein